MYSCYSKLHFITTITDILVSNFHKFLGPLLQSNVRFFVTFFAFVTTHPCGLDFSKHTANFDIHQGDPFALQANNLPEIWLRNLKILQPDFLYYLRKKPYSTLCLTDSVLRSSFATACVSISWHYRFNVSIPCSTSPPCSRLTLLSPCSAVATTLPCFGPKNIPFKLLGLWSSFPC